MSTFSTTGGRPTMHAGLDRLQADQNPAYTDWEALGLPDHSPFAILSRPRAIPATPSAPKKRGPRKNWREKVLATLDNKGNTAFNVPIMSREQSDRTLSIQGRGLS